MTVQPCVVNKLNRTSQTIEDVSLIKLFFCYLTVLTDKVSLIRKLPGVLCLSYFCAAFVFLNESETCLYLAKLISPSFDKNQLVTKSKQWATW